MPTLYAQPYDICATGFYFKTAADYDDKAATLRNDFGQQVEEFEIQFIDGDGIDAQLFESLRVHQGDIGAYLDAINEWDHDDKVKVIVAVDECGYDFDLRKDNPDRFEIDLYQADTMRDLAMQFIDEGYFGDIPKALECYIDYDAVARDLAMDYGQVEIGDTLYIYRCD